MQAEVGPPAAGGLLNLRDALHCDALHHICSRNCHYQQVLGNLHVCQSSGTMHVCDQNCEQRVQYDRFEDVCRLSKKRFPRCDAEMDADSRKRAGEELQPYEINNKRQQ